MLIQSNENMLCRSFAPSINKTDCKTWDFRSSCHHNSDLLWHHVVSQSHINLYCHADMGSVSLALFFVLMCLSAGSCIQWGGRLNQGKEWSSSNPWDARSCLFFWKRQPLGKPRCGGSTCQRSPPHRLVTSGCLQSLAPTFHGKTQLGKI